MGKCIAECMIRLSLFYWDPFLFFQGQVRTSLACEFPIAPMGDSRVARCLQGGGVYVNSGTVAITSSSIYGNTRVNGVRAHIYDFPSPMGDSRFAHCLQGGGVYVASGTVTLTSSTIYGNTVNGVRTHARKYPSPPWKTHVLLAVCRAAVSLLGEAQWPSHRPPSVATQLNGYVQALPANPPSPQWEPC